MVGGGGKQWGAEGTWWTLKPNGGGQKQVVDAEAE